MILPGTSEPVTANDTTGYIFSFELGIRATQSDLHSRLLLRLPTGLLRQKLEALLDGQKVDSIAFQPMFDQTQGSGATIRRMSDFLFAELEHSDTLLTDEMAIRSFEDNLALSVLLGLPHNYAQRLAQQKAAAAPGNVKRAEAFLRANANTALTIAEIADAAGCGVRALQIAFHRFRGATPMQVLQRARLEQARTEMLRADQTESLARIAAEHGFSSPTRFAQAFRRKYGVYPSERRVTLAGQNAAPPCREVASRRPAYPHVRADPKKCGFRFPGSLFVGRRRDRRVSVGCSSSDRASPRQADPSTRGEGTRVSPRQR